MITMELYTTDNDTLMTVLTPDQARAALKLLNFRSLLFLLTILFRSGAPGRSQPNCPP
jgi:hypothetical protein